MPTSCALKKFTPSNKGRSRGGGWGVEEGVGARAPAGEGEQRGNKQINSQQWRFVVRSFVRSPFGGTILNISVEKISILGSL